MKKKKLLVFVVEDDKYFSFLVEHYLKSKSSHHLTMHQEYDVESFTTAEDCLEEIGRKPDLVICDYALADIGEEGMNGLQFLQAARAIDSRIKVVIVSGKVDLQNAAIVSGAFDFLNKGDDIILQLGKILENVEINNDLAHERSRNWGNALIWSFLVGVSCLGILSVIF
jgi:DNA-binding NtrC family response regulator